jgi:hypothetical protein
MARLGWLLVFAAFSCERGQESSASAASSGAELDPSDPDILPLSNHSRALEGVVAISEQTYFALLSKAQYIAEPSSEVGLATSTAAEANDVHALGVVGAEAAGVMLDGQKLIVLHNQRRIDDRRFQATSFSVVSGGLTGVAEWALNDLTLQFTDEPATSCDRPFRGCQVVTTDLPHAFANWEEGGLGLPLDTRIDAETLDVPRNATGHSVELWRLPNNDVGLTLWSTTAFVGHRYRCAHPLTNEKAAACDYRFADSMPATTEPALVIPGRVGMVVESDFYAALLDGSLRGYSPAPEQVALAAKIPRFRAFVASSSRLASVRSMRCSSPARRSWKKSARSQGRCSWSLARSGSTRCGTSRT